MSEKVANPYVGPVPYDINDRRGFYGRDDDLRRLSILFIAQRILLLYSPSGAGKTSLVQARLIPALVEEGFDVLPIIRLRQQPVAATAGDNVFVAATMHVLGADGGGNANGGPLPAYWARRRAELGEKPAVLFFDQFEEVLTVDSHDHRQRVAFFDQLGAVLQADDRLWTLFAIREDYLAELDPFRHLIPGKLERGYRLELLNEEQALAAIQRPAADAGVDFSGAAAMKLVDQLRRVQVMGRDGVVRTQEGPYVEPVQLQVVCHTLWEDLEPERGTTIGAGSVVAEGHVDESLGDFYDKTVARIAATNGVEERDIRDWIGRELITEQGLRGQVMGSEDLALTADVIGDLVDAHLIRAEERRGIQWYELAHDRLVKPVQARNEAWFQANLHPLQIRAETWQRTKDDGLLLQGEALRAALVWSRNRPLRNDERQFLALSMNKERGRRNRRLALMATVIVVALFALAMFLLWQNAVAARGQAEESAALASTREAEAVLAQAETEAERVRAEEAAALASTREAEAVLAQAETEAERIRAEEAAALASTREAEAVLAQAETEAERNRAEEAADLANARLARSLAGLGLVAIDEDPLLGLALVLEGLVLVRDENQLIQARTLDEIRERVFRQGRLARLGDRVEAILHYDPDAGVMIVGHSNAPGEVRRTSDGRLLAELSGDVDRVDFSPSATGTTFVATYRDAAGDVRRATDGTLVAQLSGRVRWVSFSPDPAATVFVVYYDDGTSEMRRSADGTLLFELTDSLEYSRLGEQIFYSPDATSSVAVLDYDTARDEVRRTSDGSLLAVLPEDLVAVQFSSDPDVSLLAVSYGLGLLASTDVFDTSTGIRLTGLSGDVQEVEFIPDPISDLFIVDYQDASIPDELRRIGDAGLLSTLPGEFSQAAFFEGASVFEIYYEDRAGEVRQASDGSLLFPLSGSLSSNARNPIRYLPGDPGWVMAIDYESAPDEMRRLSDGSLLYEPPGEIAFVRWSSDDRNPLVVVHHQNGQTEVRRLRDGSLLFPSTGPADFDSFGAGGVIFSPDDPSSTVVIDYVDAQTEVRQASDGSLVARLPGEADNDSGIYYHNDPSSLVFIVDYVGAPGEIRRFSDAELVGTLAGEVAFVRIANDIEGFGSLFLVYYEDDLRHPAEVRRTTDGSLLFALSGELDFQLDTAGILASSGDSDSIIVVDYEDLPGEVRSSNDGRLLATLSGYVTAVRFDLGESDSLFAVSYSDAPGEVRHSADGSLFLELSGEVRSFPLDPGEGDRLFVVNYVDEHLPDEVRRRSDAELLSELPTDLERIRRSPDQAYVLLQYEGGAEIWAMDTTVPIDRLDDALVSNEFSLESESITILQTDGRAFVLDLAWLKAMGGRVEELSIDELVRLACDGPLSRDTIDWHFIESYLAEIGIDQPKACR